VTTVLSIAYPFAPVGPNLVGGAEQILWDMDQAIVAAGHRSLVVACEGSKPAGRLFTVPLPKRESLDEADREWCRAQFHTAINRALDSEPVDIVHVHSMDLYGYNFPPEIPLLITLHLPIDWYGDEAFAQYRNQAKFCYVSESQKRAGLARFGDAPVIGNGVEIQPINSNTRRSDFALVMGRICPEKNAHSALEAGTKAEVRVVIGGQVYPYRSHREYFEEKIQPQLNNNGPARSHEFVGPLTPESRSQLLSQAKCLLHPTLAPETSSLVAMEALAAGTPVIAYRSGALPEIIDDGVTGFLVNDVDEMAAAIRKVDAISPDACHDAAERRFSKERMIARYFDLYRSIIQERTRRTAGTFRLLRTTEELSDFVPEWRRLWSRDPHATPFQSPDWLLPWWRNFGTDDLRAVVITGAEEPIGFLPFYIYRDPATGQRQLLPLGVGTSDYLDGVFAPECSIDEIAHAVNFLKSNAEHDLFCATQLPKHSLLIRALKGPSSTGDPESSVSQSDDCSRMPAVKMAELPQKIRRNAMYYRNRAQRLGELELVQADESNWEVLFEELRQLHTMRWQTRGDEGVLADERVVRWHREAIPLLLRAGLLRLMGLKLNGQTIAVLYSLIDRVRAERAQYFYITAYSPEYADLRPGTLLIAYAVERAAEEGVAVIDMLRGNEGYKQIWHMEKVPTFCVTQSMAARAAERTEEVSAA
jgi:CelD/BcsL family acetyltransferase involved in cellulose biosynthesis/glycosyltransferase involved in cell wall biosynthesis